MAVFRQTTSRLDDPQLHSHVVISSKVQTEDGRWLALDARTLKGFQRAFGGMYQSVLRAELTARYGVAFGEIDKGQAEIAGVPTELLEQFSKRTVQVDAAFQTRVGRVLDTRRPRPDPEGTRCHRPPGRRRHPRPQVRPRHRAICAPTGSTEAAAVGVTPASLESSIRSAVRHAPAVRVRHLPGLDGRDGGATFGVASPRRAPSRLRHDPPEP